MEIDSNQPQPFQPVEVDTNICPTVITIEGSSRRLVIRQAPNLGQVSDGNRTFDELHHHCGLLFAVMVEHCGHLKPWKSRRHQNGMPPTKGWFVAGVQLPTGQVTYHLPNELWVLLDCPELETEPAYDGHNAAKVASRIATWLTSLKTQRSN